MSDGQTAALVSEVAEAPPPEGVTEVPGGGGPWKLDLAAQAGAVGAAVGAGLQAAVTLEQGLSKAFAGIAWGPFGAMRMFDLVLGMPHPHLPVAPFPPFGPVARFLPLPQPGFVLPMGFLSGSPTVHINGQQAGRLGDMGLCVPLCLGFMPLFEVFFGSATVWFDATRAARTLDPSMHCNMFDQPTGFLKLGLCVGAGSGDVLVGGVPLPSLTDAAMGKALDGAMGGFSVAAGVLAARMKRLDGLWSRIRTARLNPWRTQGGVRPWGVQGPRTIHITHFGPFSPWWLPTPNSNVTEHFNSELRRLWNDSPEVFGLPSGVNLEFLPRVDVSDEGVRRVLAQLKRNAEPGDAVVSLGELGLYRSVRIEDLHNWPRRWTGIGGHYCEKLHKAVHAAGYHAEFIHIPGYRGGVTGDFDAHLDAVVSIIRDLANEGVKG